MKLQTFIIVFLIATTGFFIHKTIKRGQQNIAQMGHDATELKDGDTLLLGADVEPGTLCIFKDGKVIRADPDKKLPQTYMMSTVTAKKGDTLLLKNKMLLPAKRSTSKVEV